MDEQFEQEDTMAEIEGEDEDAQVQVEVQQKRPSYGIFPNEPEPENGSFVEYIEKSGANEIIKEAITELFDLPNKPENPIEWCRLYFRQLVPERSDQYEAESNELQKEILKLESMITRMKIEERRLQLRLDSLQHEGNQVEVVAPRAVVDEDYKRYKDSNEDPRWRIQPDPEIILSKDDILVASDLSKKFSPEGPDAAPGEPSAENKPLSAEEERKEYTDYPDLYFGPERQRRKTKLAAAAAGELVQDPSENVEDEEEEEEGKSPEARRGKHSHKKSKGKDKDKHKKEKKGKRGSGGKSHSSSDIGDNPPQTVDDSVPALSPTPENPEEEEQAAEADEQFGDEE